MREKNGFFFLLSFRCNFCLSFTHTQNWFRKCMPSTIYNLYANYKQNTIRFIWMFCFSLLYVDRSLQWFFPFVSFEWMSVMCFVFNWNRHAQTQIAIQFNPILLFAALKFSSHAFFLRKVRASVRMCFDCTRTNQQSAYCDDNSSLTVSCTIFTETAHSIQCNKTQPATAVTTTIKTSIHLFTNRRSSINNNNNNNNRNAFS